MSPLYLYNGKLLTVDGKLAINANCCCDEECLSPCQSSVPNVVPIAWIIKNCDPDPVYPLGFPDRGPYGAETYFPATSKWPCESNLWEVRLGDGEILTSQILPDAFQDKKYIYFSLVFECAGPCAQGTCNIDIRTKLSCTDPINDPFPPDNGRQWSNCTFGPLEYYNRNSNTWDTGNNPTARCDCPDQFVAFWHHMDVSTGDACAESCLFQASSVEECQKWYFPWSPIFDPQNPSSNANLFLYPLASAKLGGCCGSTLPCWDKSCFSIWSEETGWVQYSDCENQEPPFYPFGPCVCGTPGPGDPDPDPAWIQEDGTYFEELPCGDNPFI